MLQLSAETDGSFVDIIVGSSGPELFRELTALITSTCAPTVPSVLITGTAGPAKFQGEAMGDSVLSTTSDNGSRSGAKTQQPRRLTITGGSSRGRSRLTVAGLDQNVQALPRTSESGEVPATGCPCSTGY